MKTWVVLISGFSQGDMREHGFERLYKGLERYRGPDLCLALYPWDVGVDGLASRIARDVTGGSHSIMVCGYSYGGSAAVRLCRELGRYQTTDGKPLGVDRLVLVDAVWRPVRPALFLRWLLRPLPSVLSLLPVWKIRVPENVRRCVYFRQHEDLPSGHDVEREGCSTEIEGPRVLTCPHVECDDSPWVHATVEQELQDLLTS